MPHDPLRAYIWYSIAARLASDQALRDEAAWGRDRLAQKIALPEAEAARIAAESWAPGGPDPDEGVATPRQMTSRPPGGERLSSGGSGFIVSRAGDVLTNQHVVDACRQVRVLHNGAPVVATVIATDPTADLAILRLPEPVADSALVRGDNPIKPGEAVVVVGFPLQGLLSSQASVSAGIVSRLAGPRDDPHQLQITAPVQPGTAAAHFSTRAARWPELWSPSLTLCASSNGPGRSPRTSISRSMANMPVRCSIVAECLTKPPPPTRHCRHRRSPNARSSSQSWCNASDENPSDEPGKQPDYLVPKRRSPASPSPGRM